MGKKINRTTIYVYSLLLLSDLYLLIQQASNYISIGNELLIKKFLIVILYSALLIEYFIIPIIFMRISLNKFQWVIIVLCIYFIVITIFTNTYSTENAYNVLTSFILFLIFNKIFSRANHLIKTKGVIVLQSTMFFITILIFIIARLNIDFYQSGMYTSINYSLMLLPFVICNENKYVIIIAMLLMIVASFIGNARSVFIISLFSFFVYFSIILKKDNRIFGKMWKFIIFGLFIFLIIQSFIFVKENYNVDIVDKTFNSTLDFSSGRIEVYRTVIEKYTENTITKKIFGVGFAGTTRLNASQISAHNDFLEILYNYGLIGLVIFLVFFLLIFNHISYYSRKKNTLKIPYFVSSLILFMMMISNNVFFTVGSICNLMIFLGIFSVYLKKSN